MKTRRAHHKLNYFQTIDFLKDFLYWNPQSIQNYKSKYFELARKYSFLSLTPELEFKDSVEFFAYSTLFGSEIFTLKESKDYCTREYQKLDEKTLKITLSRLYSSFRRVEPRLPSSPRTYYSFGDDFTIQYLFSLVKVDLFTYEQAKQFCTNQLFISTFSVKNLKKFYYELRLLEPRLPSAPHITYKGQGWVSFCNFFNLEERNLFTYSEARNYCISEYQKTIKLHSIKNLYAFYSDLRIKQPKLPSRPHITYENHGWISFKSLFNIETFFSYKECCSYCTKAYDELFGFDNPSNLNNFYYKLRQNEPRLPSGPYKFYKVQGLTSIKELFGLRKTVLFTLHEAIDYCHSQKRNLIKSGVSRGTFYERLRSIEKRLPSTPQAHYRQKHGRITLKTLFGL
ncbi:MAG: hypothetical protein GYB58_21320 [Gammaproteobacteria bacterium]|nr:hypothetical protein [Gammaproteobacteria bacterium]